MCKHNIDAWKKPGLTGLLMASLIVLASTSVAQADTAPRKGGMMQWDGSDRVGPYGGWGRHGMMGWGDDMMGMMDGGYGMMRGYGMQRYGGLDLSADQMSKIDKIRDEIRKKHWDLMGKMMDEGVRLRELRNAEQPDPAVIGKQYAKIQDLRRQMLEQSIDAENRMEALLTKEQKDQFRKMRRWGGGE